MAPHLRHQIRQDLALIERFSRSYHDQFAQLIEDLNQHPTPATGQRSLRLCVEAVNMMLQTQTQLASAIRALGDEAQTPYPRRVAG